MKKTKWIFISVFVFQFIINVQAQKNYRSAFIITLHDDTIHGLINDPQWLKNPDRISFKEKEQSQEQHFNPYTLKAVVIDSGDYYVSASIHVDRNYATNSDISTVYSVDTGSKDNVFLRVLLQSRLSLYLFTDENAKDHFYLRSENGNYQELICKKIPVINNANTGTIVDRNKTFLLNDTRYTNQLKALMKDCPVAVSKVDGVDYAERDLVELLKMYNQCLPETKIEYMNLPMENHATWQMITGLDMAQLSFKGDNNLGDADFSKSYRPVIGIRAMLPLNRNRLKYHLITELCFRQYDTKGHSQSSPDALGTEIYDEYSIHFQMNYAKLNIALQDNFIKSGIEPYFNLGLTAAYLMRQLNEMIILHHDPYHLDYPQTITQLPTEAALSEYTNQDTGYFGSIGARYKKFTAEARYERSTGFSHSSDMASSVRTFYFLVSYQLSKN